MTERPSILKLLLLAGATGAFAWQSPRLTAAFGLVGGSTVRASSLANQQFLALAQSTWVRELEAVQGCGEILLLNHEHNHFAMPDPAPLPSTILVALAFHGMALPKSTPDVPADALVRPPCRLSFNGCAAIEGLLTQGQ